MTSSNQEPGVCWRHGAQFVALNWQRFDVGMMQNEAMFVESGGYVLKPAYVHDANVKKKTFLLSIQVHFCLLRLMEIIGASGLPCPEDLKDVGDLDPYVKVKLDAETEIIRETKKKKDTGPNVIWDEQLNFGKVEDNLAFLT